MRAVKDTPVTRLLGCFPLWIEEKKSGWSLMIFCACTTRGLPGKRGVSAPRGRAGKTEAGPRWTRSVKESPIRPGLAGIRSIH